MSFERERVAPLRAATPEALDARLGQGDLPDPLQMVPETGAPPTA